MSGDTGHLSEPGFLDEHDRARRGRDVIGLASSAFDTGAALVLVLLTGWWPVLALAIYTGWRAYERTVRLTGSR